MAKQPNLNEMTRIPDSTRPVPIIGDESLPPVRSNRWLWIAGLTGGVALIAVIIGFFIGQGPACDCETDSNSLNVSLDGTLQVAMDQSVSLLGTAESNATLAYDQALTAQANFSRSAEDEQRARTTADAAMTTLSAMASIPPSTPDNSLAVVNATLAAELTNAAIAATTSALQVTNAQIAATNSNATAQAAELALDLERTLVTSLQNQATQAAGTIAAYQAATPEPEGVVATTPAPTQVSIIPPPVNTVFGPTIARVNSLSAFVRPIPDDLAPSQNRLSQDQEVLVRGRTSDNLWLQVEIAQGRERLVGFVLTSNMIFASGSINVLPLIDPANPSVIPPQPSIFFRIVESNQVFPYEVRPATPPFQESINHASCVWQGFAGQVFGPNGAGQPGLVVRVTGAEVLNHVSGTDPEHGEGGWEVTVNTQPSLNRYTIQLFASDNTRALSPAVEVFFPGFCDENLFRLDFVQTPQG